LFQLGTFVNLAYLVEKLRYIREKETVSIPVFGKRGSIDEFKCLLYRPKHLHEQSILSLNRDADEIAL